MWNQLALLALALTPLSVAQTSNNFESGWDQTAWPVYAPDCNQGGTVALDSTIAHSGKNSLKVTGGPNGYCGHIFFGTTKVPSSGDLYVRTWLRASKSFSGQHVTFITMPDSSIGGKHLRVSDQQQIIEYNRESDDATLPDLSPNGIATSVQIPTNTWECLEYRIATNGTIQTWWNGSAVSGLTYGSSASNPNAQGWSRQSYTPKITGVYFGWEAYSGDVNTFWYDDIVISSSKVGCS